MDLHIQSFSKEKWDIIKTILDKSKSHIYATKLVFFAPQTLKKPQIEEINKIEYVHDKPTSDFEIFKGEPVCTILYTGNSFAESYFGALKIVDKIERLIKTNID